MVRPLKLWMIIAPRIHRLRLGRSQYQCGYGARRIKLTSLYWLEVAVQLPIFITDHSITHNST